MLGYSNNYIIVINMEFMYLAPEKTTVELWNRIGPSVQVLALNLHKTQSPYA